MMLILMFASEDVKSDRSARPEAEMPIVPKS